MMRTVFWRARSRSMRKSLKAMRRCARDSSRFAIPRSASAYSSMSSNGSFELKMKETAVLPLSRWRRACSNVVLPVPTFPVSTRSEEHTSELQSPMYLVCRLLLEKKKKKNTQLDYLKDKEELILNSQ